MNQTNVSNGSSEYEINSDTLDILYKEQLQVLRDLILKQNQTHDIELCGKWLKVFSKTSKAEKVARNCLCSLMQQQLQDYGYLGRPFTDMQNCNRNLEIVLREVDNQSFVTQQTETIETYTSHHKQEIHMFKTDDVPLGAVSECLENETQTENVLLRRELESIRLKLTEKQIENVRLKEIAEKYELESSKHTETLNAIKQQLMESIQRALIDLEAEEHCFPFKIFEKVLHDFSTDINFSRNIKNYDENFQLLLNKKFEHEFSKRKALIARHVSRKFGKTKIKLREKYERRLRVQGWAQRLQLKLVKLKCFSVLRHIFISTQKGGSNSEAMWEMLKLLEEKYQAIVNEIL